jgi:hypothetical protein
VEIAVKFSERTIRLQLFEEVEEINETRKAFKTELLGVFALTSIPRQGELIAVRAFGEPNWNGFSENLYEVLTVMHHACHIAWDTLTEKRRELEAGPSISIFVRFRSHRDPSPHGGWIGSGRKGRLRRDDLEPQKYNLDDGNRE